MKSLLVFLLPFTFILLLGSCTDSKDTYDELLAYGEAMTTYSSIEYKADHIINRSYSTQPSNRKGLIYFEENPSDSLYGINYFMDIQFKGRPFTLLYNQNGHLTLSRREKKVSTIESGNVRYYSQPLYLESTETIRNLLRADSMRYKVTHLTMNDTLIKGQKSVVFSFQVPEKFLYPNYRSYNPSATYVTQHVKLAFSKKEQLPNYMRVFEKFSTGSHTNEVYFTDIKLNKKYPSRKTSFESVPEDYNWNSTLNESTLLAIGVKAPDWSMPLLQASGSSSFLTDENVSAQSLQGKPYLLEFWFIGCGPCIKAVPDLNQLHAKYAGNDFEIYGVNIFENSPEHIVKYKMNKNINFPTLWKGDKVAKEFKVQGAPIFYLVDADGTIKYRSLGHPGYDVLEEEIRKVMKNVNG